MGRNPAEATLNRTEETNTLFHQLEKCYAVQDIFGGSVSVVIIRFPELLVCRCKFGLTKK